MKTHEEIKTTYNGWTNYETWNVKLWLDNEEHTYNAALELAKIHKNNPYDLAMYLEQWHDEMTPEIRGTFADLLGAALAKVNWQEIAESLIEQTEE